METRIAVSAFTTALGSGLIIRCPGAIRPDGKSPAVVVSMNEEIAPNLTLLAAALDKAFEALDKEVIIDVTERGK